MKFFNRLFNRMKKKAVTFFSSPLRLLGTEDWYDALNLQTFKNSLYLFIGVSMIREEVSSIPLELYQIKNSDGDTEQVMDDEFLDLIERPNDKQTQKEFWKLAIAYYLLAGETFWYLERPTPEAKPTAMANMRPDYVEVIFSADKRDIVAYEFNNLSGQVVKLRPEDVLHIKNIDPTNPARGVGVIRPATQRIITEQEASKYQAETFKNQGRPDIAVFTEVDLTDEDAEEARNRWNKIYGKERGSAAGFFGKNVKDLKLLNVSPKEMDFIQSQNFLRDDILAALRIPKQMIDTDVNYANSKVAYATFLRQACEPVLDAFIDIINNKLLNDQDENRFLTYDSLADEDREMLLKEAVELKKAGIITVNESRAIMNYPEVEDGDVREDSSVGSLFQMSIKKAKVRKQALKILRKRKVLLRKFKATHALSDFIVKQRALNDLKRGRSSVFNTPELKEKYIKAFNEDIDNRAESFKETLDVYNDGLLKRIKKQMEDFGINPDKVFDIVQEIPEAKKAFVPLMKNLFRKTGQDTMDSIANGFSNKASEQFYTTDEIIQLLEHRAEFFISSMLDTDFKQMKEIIASGLEEGLGIDAIGRRLRDYFEDMSVSRSRTIARTETARIISQATESAYIQSEVVTGKEWLTARDSKVRNITGTVNDHVVNDGKVVAPDGVFPNGERYPGELTINCRCAIAPAV